MATDYVRALCLHMWRDRNIHVKLMLFALVGKARGDFSK